MSSEGYYLSGESLIKNGPLFMDNGETNRSLKRSAAFLIAIGPQAASEVMRNFDDDTVIRLTSEMARIESLSPGDKEEIIGDFMIEINRMKHTSFGGEAVARKILVDSLGSERAEEIYSKAQQLSPKAQFSFLKDVSPEIIKQLLNGEQPQTSAVVLSYISPDKAAKVLKQLGDSAPDIALRIAKMSKVVPEAVIRISQALKKKYEKMQSVEFGDTPGGVDALSDILNHLDGGTEQTILDHLEKSVPEEARIIQEKIYTFENIAGLTNAEIRIVIDAVGDDNLIALSLKGAGDEIRFRILRNMSNNRATDILSDMERMGAVRMSEILEARKYITTVMRQLNEEGRIFFKKDKDTLVE